MSEHFPICDLRFDLETSPAKIEAELTRFLRKLRWVALGHDPADFEAARDDECWDDAMRACRPSLQDGDRIRRRASALADRRLIASGMAHHRLATAAAFRWGLVFEIVLAALQVAIGRGARELTRQDFDKAWAKKTGTAEIASPFSSPNYRSIYRRDRPFEEAFLD